MSQNAIIVFEGVEYQTEPDETILNCLLRHGVSTSYSCRNGVCQTCTLKSIEGKPTKESQKGLKPTQQEQNLFLPCVCKPQENMEVSFVNSILTHYDAKVLQKDILGTSVIRLRLEKPPGFEYRAGQFVNLFRDVATSRSYSLASVPDVDDYLELHIKHIKNGRMSHWVFKDLMLGDTVSISDAIGENYYSVNDPTTMLLLIGTGTGLAPLYGILKEALDRGHSGPIRLYHGARYTHDCYLHGELEQLSEKFPQLEYFSCVSAELPADLSSEPYRNGRVNEIALLENKDLKDAHVFLCGNPDMVKHTHRQVFLAGVALQNIHSDPFLFA